MRKRLGILINKPLTNNQFIRLFSNPVSGIACESGYIDRMELPARERLWKIRYSKSMILNALYFWEKQYKEFYKRLERAMFNPLFKYSPYKEDGILDAIMLVHNLPDSFLFSHRYIQAGKFGDNNGDDNQCFLIKKKYPILKNYPFYYQKTKHEVFFRKYFKQPSTIEFTVFPNEHPYIPRNKISKVGMTDRGNIYVLHRKKKERCVKK